MFILILFSHYQSDENPRTSILNSYMLILGETKVGLTILWSWSGL